jgi:(p)ppGpp synthase/HD superfamily hydrolase
MPLPGCFLPTEHKTPQKRKNKTKSPLQNKFNYGNCKPLLAAVGGSRSSTSAVARSSSADRPSPQQTPTRNKRGKQTHEREKEDKNSKGTTSAVKKLTTELVNKLSSCVQIACISSKLVKYQNIN